MIFYPNFHSLKYGLKWVEFGLYSYFLSSCIKNGHPLFLASKCIIHSPRKRQVIKTKTPKESQSHHHIYRASYWQQRAAGRGPNKGSEWLILRAKRQDVTTDRWRAQPQDTVHWSLSTVHTLAITYGVLTSYSLGCISIITSFKHLIVQWSLDGAGTENYIKQIEFISFVRNAGKQQGKEGVNEINIENEKI